MPEMGRKEGVEKVGRIIKIKHSGSPERGGLESIRIRKDKYQSECNLEHQTDHSGDTEVSDEELICLISLTKIPSLGGITARKLLSEYGSAKEVFWGNPSKIKQVKGINKKLVDSIHNFRGFDQAKAELDFCKRHNISILPLGSHGYPAQLAEIFSAPVVLYCKGDSSLLSRPSVSIVGTRKPSPYGKEVAHFFSQSLSRKSLNIVSGLAFGIDILAHETAMETGGKTIAVLGHGLDQIYPSQHRAKAKKIVNQGALVTEYCSKSRIDPNNFPARNRIISGLSSATIVIEAGEKGGALITAHFAFDQNREVFAVPGTIGSKTSIGCNNLIKGQVAKLVTHPDEVLKELELVLGKIPVPKIENTIEEKKESTEPVERKILSFVEAHIETTLDQIKSGLKMPYQKLRPYLMALEFKGYLQQLPGNRYRRTI